MFKIITLPFDRKIKGFDDETLNKSILNKKVKSHKAEFFQDADDKYWTILVEYDAVLEKSYKKDDMVFFANCKEDIKDVLNDTRVFLSDRLKLKLNPRYTFLNSRLNGLPFLGFRIFPNLKRIKKGNLKRTKTKLEEKRTAFQAGKITEDHFVMSTRSMYDHIGYADSFKLRSKFLVPWAGVE